MSDLKIGDKGRCIMMHMFNSLTVDKLGWYKRRDGENVKLVHIYSEGLLSGCGIIVDNSSSYTVNSKGICSFSSAIFNSGDLVEYIGPELPAQPREYTFEAYLGEDDNTPGVKQYYSIDHNLDHDCSNFCIDKEFLRKTFTYKKISKWEVTMKEIIE